jgi:hypothetical protein
MSEMPRHAELLIMRGRRWRLIDLGAGFVDRDDDLIVTTP